ncbi:MULTISPECIES: hypothetical protein [Pseudomonas]|jgi:hypothetical protein|uniref:hypothetical protein n=1 Tax=Pseudomonas TaxID=286 RepID=UPI0018E8E3F6|nr:MULTISPECIES: hypothetical protein [Pseudomonas]MBJ2214040.1 hypothetical protein [Pseudomonas carnis]MBP5947910.1 hypothetical protein [Pseudomonas sp. P9(2020)]
MKTNDKISENKDQMHRRLLNSPAGRFLTRGMGCDIEMLLETGTPAERAKVAKKVGVRSLAILALGVVVVLMTTPGEIKTIDPVPVVTTQEPAGTIQSIQLHDTALSTSTTVVTGTGTYHVRGAVSASPGDVVTMKKESPGAMERASLCVESHIKATCYSLL